MVIQTKITNLSKQNSVPSEFIIFTLSKRTMDKPENVRKHFMRKAADLAAHAVRNNLGGPFGAVVVREGVIIGEGYNTVTSVNDPTAHAEIVAIRNACRYLGSFQLTDCDLYSTCEPCPMCMGAIYWARPKNLYYASTREDAADAGFDDSFIYDELARPSAQRSITTTYTPAKEAVELFRLWKSKDDKIRY